MITLNLDSIQDPAVKQAMESLVDQLNKTSILAGDWDFVKANFQTSGGSQTVFHRLKSIPIDIITLAVPSGANLSITNKTKDSIVINSAVKGEIRLLIGRIQKG